jgi:hypothetical protein
LNVDIDTECYCWKLFSVKDVETKQPRKDGKYPEWVNAIYSFHSVCQGQPAFLKRIQTNAGEMDEGYLMTSVIQDIQMSCNNESLTLITENSIYELHLAGIQADDD